MRSFKIFITFILFFSTACFAGQKVFTYGCPMATDEKAEKELKAKWGENFQADKSKGLCRIVISEKPGDCPAISNSEFYVPAPKSCILLKYFDDKVFNSYGGDIEGIKIKKGHRYILDATRVQAHRVELSVDSPNTEGEYDKFIVEKFISDKKM